MSGQRWRGGQAEVERDVVGGVPASGLGGIKPAGWSPVRDAVGHVAGPAAFAVLAVVESAGEGEILQVGAATVDPRGDVVGFAPVRGPITTWETTAAIPGGEGAALPGAGGAAGQPVVEDPAGVTEDDGHDVGLGGDLQRLRHADDAAVRGGGQTGAGLHLLQGHREKDGGGGATSIGQGARAEQPLSGVEQRVVPALPGT